MKNNIEIQDDIARTLKVTTEFDVTHEINRRILFLQDYLTHTKLRTLVLGISGGIDSTIAGRLAQISVEGLRKNHYPCEFIAVRLPYGEQADEIDAQAALQYIRPDKVLTINIKQTCDSMLATMIESGHVFHSEGQQDFVLGNIKARERMVVQYAIAGTHQGLVIGTDHAAEALMGFFTKYGDGASDIVPLYGLTKRRIKTIGYALGVPEILIHKKPTADLENLRPLRLDEEVYGVTYDNIDDFLERKPVTDQVFNKILNAFYNSAHKRCLPLTPE